MVKMERGSVQRSQNSEQLSKIDETMSWITTLTSQSERIKKIEEAQASLMLKADLQDFDFEASEADSLDELSTRSRRELKRAERDAERASRRELRHKVRS